MPDEDDIAALSPSDQDAMENAGYDADPKPGPTEDEEPRADDEVEEAESTDDSSEPTWTPQEISAAKRFGLSEEDYQALGEKGKDFAARLAKTQSDIGRRYSELGRAESAARDAPEVKSEPTIEKFEHTFSEDIYGPEEAAALTQLATSFNRMQAMMEGVHKSSKAAEAAETERAADAFFVSLDTKTYPEFGEGRGAELDRDGSELEARNRVFDKAVQLSLGHERATGIPMDFEDALQQALLIEAPNAQVETARRNARDRRKHAVPRPDKNRSTRRPMSSDEKTMAALSKKEAELGVHFFLDKD